MSENRSDRAGATGAADPADVVIEVRMRLTPRMAQELEAGVPCRELRLERIGDGEAALLLYASEREHWLLNVMAHAERAPFN